METDMENLSEKRSGLTVSLWFMGCVKPGGYGGYHLFGLRNGMCNKDNLLSEQARQTCIIVSFFYCDQHPGIDEQ